MATTKVKNEKTRIAKSLMPLAYIWCAQTREPAKAIAKLDKAIAQ